MQSIEISGKHHSMILFTFITLVYTCFHKRSRFQRGLLFTCLRYVYESIRHLLLNEKVANLKRHVYYIVTHKYLYSVSIGTVSIGCIAMCHTNTCVCNEYSYQMRVENSMQFRCVEQKDSGKHVSCCCNNFTCFCGYALQRHIWMKTCDTWGWQNCTKVIKFTEERNIKKLHIKTRRENK